MNYKVGRGLVGNRTSKSQQVTESQFADDVALCSTSCQGFESISKAFIQAIKYVYIRDPSELYTFTVMASYGIISLGKKLTHNCCS